LRKNVERRPYTAHFTVYNQLTTFPALFRVETQHLTKWPVLKTCRQSLNETAMNYLQKSNIKISTSIK